MGLFDKLFSSASSEFSYSPKNEQEAMIAIMYSCIAADGNVSDAEIDKLIQLFVFKKPFKGHNLADYYKTITPAHKKIGSKDMINASVSKVSGGYRPMLFALVMELVLSDGIMDQKEQEIVEFLSKALSLDDYLASKIVEVILIKNKDNVEIID